MIGISNLERLLNSDNLNGSIIELDNFIAELCSYGDNLEKLTEPQKIFYFNQNLEREVNNGGFNQYFINSSGNFAHETLNSLKLIGAHYTADILQSAINEFPNGKVPRNRDERIDLVDRIAENSNEQWTALDQKFYEYNDDLNQLNIEFVKKNRNSF